MNLQSSSGEAEASGSQANHHHHQHHSHSHHHARLEEHDYIGMSEQQVFPNATLKSTSSSANKSKELNMRRTELQLGLPGSPAEDEDTGPFSATMQLKKSPHTNGGLVVNSSTNNNNNNSNSPNAKLLDDKDKDKDGANARPRGGGGVGSSSSSSSCHLIKNPPRTAVVDETPDCVEKQETRAPVGWPPVQSFRKNSLNGPSNNNNNNANNNNNNNNNSNSNNKVSENATNPGPTNPATVGPAGNSATPTPPPSSQLVKVYMDGVPIGRKVNLRTHSSYDKLSAALEEMFKRFINGQSGSNKAMKEKLANESKKFNFIYGSDYVLTYEDKDGDLMLVGDVPWVMFVGTVKRLRIMKGSEAIGLAPRDQQPSLAPAAPNTK